MKRLTLLLLLVPGLFLGAETPAPGPTRWATEVDVLPVATGGWYASVAAGRDVWRLRLVAAEVHLPDRFAPAGWEKARTRAQALLVDRFFRAGFAGPWIGGGLERWDEDLKGARGPERVRLESLQATFGMGWVVPLGRGFQVNPWVAVHRRIGGDRAVSSSQGECRPKALQAEVSVKIGYLF
ncbi:hypothetical protein [Mesoterricola silvestris]|uniref:DUF3575 domain-containing protein n=1 Tax=Mesoterricola silvestris TaxID=2927979 RepID=A0AA48GMP6_9BACT|nr:hypothetical protein [Mesoterricola silvestris]BDU74154.1 hypothetical protein METEAL_33280 [Mesoterricola silvestris]